MGSLVPEEDVVLAVLGVGKKKLLQTDEVRSRLQNYNMSVGSIEEGTHSNAA